MRAVNLLPRDEARARRKVGLPGPWVFVAAVAPLLAAGLVYVGYSSGHSSLATKRAALGAVHAQIRALSGAKANDAAGEASLVSERTLRQAALVDALAKGEAWDVTLDDLARVIPTDVWLTTLTAQSPTPAGVAAPPVATTPNVNGFTLTGYAHSQEAVAHLLARLQLLPMLNDVTLGSTTASDSATSAPVIQFQLTAAMEPTPQAPTP